MPKRKKKSEAWKNLVRTHTKGPKRVKFKRERKTKHKDPLKSAEMSGIIEFQLFDVFGKPRYISFLVVNSILRRLSLRLGESRTYRKNSLPKWFKNFEKSFSGNGEVTLSNFIGRCYIFHTKIKTQKVVIKIIPTEEEEERQRAVKARVLQLFKGSACTKKLAEGSEYM